MKNWFYRNDIWLLVGGWVLVVFPAILFVGMTLIVARTELQDYRKTLRKSDAHAMREAGRVAACLERMGSSAAERAALRNARAGPIRLNSEPGPISGFSAVRKRRIGHAAGLCTAGRFGRLRRTGNRPAVHNPCGVPRSSLKPLSSAPSGWRSRTRPVSFDQGSSAAGVCCRTR